MFARFHMACVGCAMAPFETLSDAAAAYALDAQTIRHEILRAFREGKETTITRNLNEGEVAVLNRLDHLLSPHCKREEIFLYPASRRAVGEVRVQRLMTEHDGVYRSLRRLSELAEAPRWSEADHRLADEHWGVLIEHAIHCTTSAAMPAYCRRIFYGTWRMDYGPSAGTRSQTTADSPA